MFRRVVINQLIAGLLSIVFLCQTVLGAQGLVMCRHPDGSTQVENLAEQANCHSAALQARAATASASANNCTDQLIKAPAVSSQQSSDHSLRISLAPLSFPSLLPWDLFSLAEPKKLPLLSRVDDATSPAAEQLALRISAVVLVI